MSTNRAQSLRKLVLGDALSTTSREHLAARLLANKAGDKRLRAGVPADWRVGDKTGANGATNDIAIVWPPGRAPILMSVYLRNRRHQTTNEMRFLRRRDGSWRRASEDPSDSIHPG